MLVTDDIEKILLMDVKKMQIGKAVSSIYRKGVEPVFDGCISERIVINVVSLTNEAWARGFANINIFIPNRKDIGYVAADLKRLGRLQRMASEDFEKPATGILRGYRYIYSLSDSPKIEEDKPVNGYFVNVKLKIKVQNF